MKQPAGIFYDWTGAPVERLPDRIQTSASAFILDGQGRVLLHLRRDNHHWALPGGRQDVGESITQTCIREVWEETGLHVRVKRLIGVYTDPAQFLVASYPGGELVQICNLCFECEIIGGQIAVSSESIDIGFYPPHALPQPVLLAHKIRIQDALAHAPQPFVR
ncbi:MAG: NUDIX domain-containing protein [Thermoflexales bacterium]|nr:NUDIX domain-containing protein [Thermoflexales bacterium]MDW8352508.1 NUDIX domain-containing protein [Anaerolineae bacterium]